MMQGERVTAPRWPVAATSASALISIATAITGSGLLGDAYVVPLAGGYLLGAIASVVFQILYKIQRNRVRPEPNFRPQPGVDNCVNVAMIVGLLAGIANAFFLATELAK